MSRKQMNTVELCSKLADVLAEVRHFVDPAQFVNHYFSLLLIKRLSDLFDDEYSTIYDRERQHGLSEQEAKSIAEDPDEYRFFVPPEARWLKLATAGDRVVETFSSACRTLETSLPPAFLGTLHDVLSAPPEFSKIDTLQLLRRTIAKLNTVSFSDRDLTSPHVIGQAAEMHLREIAASHNKALEEAMLPPYLAKRLAEVIQPQEGMRIYDPLCGTGTALLACHRHLLAGSHDARNLSLFAHVGLDDDGALARIMLLLHNQPDFRVGREDAISTPILNSDQTLTTFDLVVSNLARSHFEVNWKTLLADRNERFLLSSSQQRRGEVVYAQHVAAVLNDRGRAALIVPQGMLFRCGWEREVRAEWLKPEIDIVEAVISLPNKIHLGADISCSILVLNRRKDGERQGKILFIDKLPRESQRDRQELIVDEELFEMIVIYRSFANPDRYAETATKLADEWKTQARFFVTQVSDGDESQALYWREIEKIKAEVVAWSRDRGRGAAKVVSTEEIMQQHDSNLNPSHYIEGGREYDVEVMTELAELERLEDARNKEERRMHELLARLGLES